MLYISVFDVSLGFFHNFLKVLQYVGRLDADVLRDVIVKQYTGDENLSKRQWSGVQSHLASMNQERKAGSPVSRLRKSDSISVVAIINTL